ncbi:hypothetical protein M3O96_20440 [Aquiflexum sp. TKW24L]|uniref:hypothetical protein n=1 Tax=Aquiflexum sp. TKW24L TaxID=2942212 RepID=UPI0020C136F3|nr:hypothetical protein [Aquiflexum sp. TKW24L]MCL6261480.1 hypothetical protein [Aquiflexum sp. TKW24L]
MAKKATTPLESILISYQARCREDKWVGPKRKNADDAYVDGENHRRDQPNDNHFIDVIVTQKIMYTLKHKG